MGVGVLLRYGRHLPLTPRTPLLTLGEGSTPLVRSRSIEHQLGVGALYFKLEGTNPTGSFKDRGMVVAVAKAVEEGSTTILCASTGNTSASAAAYGARAGLRTIVLVPKGTVAEGKLAQVMAYGARIVVLRGSFDQALQLARSLAEQFPISLVNSVNPHRLQGQKTAAFEVVDSLGDAPDYLFIPVGNAGNITAYWMGFQEYLDTSVATRAPAMMGFQAAGAAPIVLGRPVENPTTIASAIRIGNPASWIPAKRSSEQSGGTIDSVTDEEILDAYRLLARREGVFGEPTSAVSLAGLVKVVQEGRVDLRDKVVVCVITGTGLKDPGIAHASAATPVEECDADFGAVVHLLDLAPTGT